MVYTITYLIASSILGIIVTIDGRDIGRVKVASVVPAMVVEVKLQNEYFKVVVLCNYCLRFKRKGLLSNVG